MRRIVFVAFLFLFAPLSVSAQGVLGIPQVVPQCGQMIQGFLVNPCQFCHFVELAQNLMIVGIYLAVTIATFMFVFAGAKYMLAAGDTAKINATHKIFRATFFGLIITLLGFTTIDTLMQTFWNPDNAGPWNNIECVSQSPGHQLGVAPEITDSQLDSDGDGVVDSQDNCVYYANPDQANTRGNPVTNQPDNLGDVCQNSGDIDNDGIRDEVDRCASIPNGGAGGQVDFDNDGTPDACDLDFYYPDYGEIPTTGYCAANVLRPYWGDRTSLGSCICNRESGGRPTAGIQNGTDRLLLEQGQPGFSFSLYQINITANEVICNGQTLNCPAAFTDLSQTNAAQCQAAIAAYKQRNPGLAGVSLSGSSGWCKVISDQGLYNQCRNALVNPQCSGATAADMYGEAGYSPWRITWKPDPCAQYAN